MLFQLYLANKIFVIHIWPLWKNHKYLFSTFLTGICSKLVRFPVGAVFSKISVLLHCIAETFSEWHPSPCPYILLFKWCTTCLILHRMEIRVSLLWDIWNSSCNLHYEGTYCELERSPCCASFSWWHTSLLGRLTVLALNQDLFCCWIMTLCSTLDIWLA